jgi:hypothetical protein
MSKRFTDTEKWKDDWYISLSNDYRIIWQWLLDNCNHAGICKRSIKLLNFMCNTNITEEELIAEMEGRLIIKNNIWFIPKFLKFQYPSLKSKKPVIVSVIKELKTNDLFNLIPESFGNDYVIVTELLDNDYLIIKDKDKDKDKDKVKDIIISNGKYFKKEEFNEVPEYIVFSVIQQFQISKQQTITEKQVTDMWQVFKEQNLTGDKFYNNENEVYKHFVNWINKQKFEKNAKPTAEDKFNAYKEYANRYS